MHKVKPSTTIVSLARLRSFDGQCARVNGSRDSTIMNALCSLCRVMQSADDYWGGGLSTPSKAPTAPVSAPSAPSAAIPYAGYSDAYTARTQQSSHPAQHIARRLPGDTPWKMGHASPSAEGIGFVVPGGGPRFKAAARRYDVDGTGRRAMGVCKFEFQAPSRLCAVGGRCPFAPPICEYTARSLCA